MRSLLGWCLLAGGGRSCRLPSVGWSRLTSLLGIEGADGVEEEEPEDEEEYELCICRRRAGGDGGGFELGGARLWSVAGPVTPLPVLQPLLVVVCASASGMLGDMLLGGVESARLDAVRVDDPDPNEEDGEDVVGIHNDSRACACAREQQCALGGRKINYYWDYCYLYLNQSPKLG